MENYTNRELIGYYIRITNRLRRPAVKLQSNPHLPASRMPLRANQCLPTGVVYYVRGLFNPDGAMGLEGRYRSVPQDRWPLLSSPVLELGLISWLVPTVPASSLYTSSPIITYSAPGCLCSKVLAFSGSIAHCLLYASSLSDR